MNTANFRFYEELNGFLPEEKRKQTFPFNFHNNPSIKDAIEAQGVPHTEVDLVLINGISVDFNHQLQDGDNVSVYPVFEALDIGNVTHLRPSTLRDVKFILDVHLGKLAHHLRMLGFDALYQNHFQDEKIMAIALNEKRIILTRDVGILKNAKVTHGYFLRATNPTEQTKEIIKRFDLRHKITPFIRCIECNDLLIDVDKEKISEKLPEKTKDYYDIFKQCQGCKKIYWQGSHFVKMKKFIASLKNSL